MDFSWAEMLVIGVVALIVLGDDLPGVFRTMGRFTGKIRRMAREFQRAMEDAADESGMRETAANLKEMTSPSKMGLDRLNQAADKFEKWDPTKPSGTSKGKDPDAEQRAENARKIEDIVEKKRASEAPTEKTDDAT
ncbi:MAG: twin-arginine translocase subunit TatB [Pseudomonadota bacterium]